jgi:AraC-like DNA-binding protein
LAYYETQQPDVRELVLPTGCMNLIVNLAEDETRWYDGDDFATTHTRGGTVLVNAFSRPLGVDTAEQCAGVYVAFRPGGAYPFFPSPASALDEPLVELDALWAHEGVVLRERLLEAPTPEAALSTVEASLLAQGVRSAEPDRVVARAVALLDQGVSVVEVADRVGITDRTLRRRFTEQIGLTPKGFGRVRRLHRLLASLPVDEEVDWARAATDSGYFDQAHLINDFRALTAMTPSAYQPRPAGCEAHHVALPG